MNLDQRNIIVVIVNIFWFNLSEEAKYGTLLTSSNFNCG